MAVISVMTALIFSLANIIINLSSAGDCPSSLWTECASEHGYCSVANNIKEGYMSYGVYPHFVLIPFEKDNNGDLDIWCGNEKRGDPYPGKTKTCCYIKKDDPVWDPEATFANDEWTICGNEGYKCSGLEKNVPQWIRYGHNGKYEDRLIMTTNGYMNCYDSLFSDPDVGNTKHCWRSSPYGFDNMVGKWERIPHCHNCDASIYTYSWGVTGLTQTEISNTWSNSLSKELSGGISLGPFSAGGSVGTEQTQQVSRSMTTAFETTATRELEYECNKDNFYQFMLSSTSESALSSRPFEVKFNDFACIDGTEPPQCVPGKCADDNCQECAK